MPTTSPAKSAALIERFRRIISGALELVIDGAEAYWLEDELGHVVPPESDRSLAPLLLALGLIRQGRTPGSLTLYARLGDGERFRITSGDSLVDIAEHTAGIPRRPRTGRGAETMIDTPLRQVTVDPVGWREDPESREIPILEAVSILLAPTSIARDGAPRTTTDPWSDATIPKLGRSLAEPKELVLDHAEAYWLEDRDGRRIGPESDRSLAPLFLSLGLVREGRDPESLMLCARLADGVRFEVGGGPCLIAVAAHTAGIPRDHGASPLA